jgi:DNA-binding transcriptional MerR regulator
LTLTPRHGRWWCHGGQDGGAVAGLTGASVRTPHHYDHTGLVVPSTRSAAGYRCYTDAEVERLHLVLVYRAAGLPLDEIAVLLDDPHVDTLAHLRRQLVLRAQSVRLHDTISDRANILVRRHAAGKQFYDCDPSTQIALAEMYLADVRFTRHYDDGAGLGHDIIVAGAAT